MAQTDSDKNERRPARISIIIPMYNEERTVRELWRRLSAVLSGINFSREIIFINDGSSDGTLEALKDIAGTEPDIKIVDLSRNFGHPQAVTAGIDMARGDAVVIMDGDLQDAPEAIPRFIERWREGYDVVYAIREKRKENVLKRGAFYLFYRIQRRLVQIDVPIDAGLFSLIDAGVADTLRRMPERNKYLPGLRAYAGFRQTGVPVERNERFEGAPRVTLYRLFGLALDAIFSYSLIPIRIATVMGGIISTVSLAIAVFSLIFRLSTGETLLGWRFGLTTAFFMFGVVLVFLGVIGEYIGRIYEEVKGRPYYVVRELYSSATASDSPLPDENTGDP